MQSKSHCLFIGIFLLTILGIQFLHFFRFRLLPAHHDRDTSGAEWGSKGETYISDTGEFGIHSGIGNQETIARPRLGIFLVNFDLELAPSRHVVLCIQIVAEHVVRRRVIGSALETARQIVGIVEGATAGHFGEVPKSINFGVLQPAPRHQLLHGRRSTSGASCGDVRRGGVVHQTSYVNRVDGDLSVIQHLHCSLIQDREAATGHRRWRIQVEGKCASSPDQRFSARDAG